MLQYLPNFVFLKNKIAVPTIVKDLNGLFETKIRPQIGIMSGAIPAHQYHRFHQMFNWTLQRLVFAAAMTFYLEKETLIQRPDACAYLGLKLDPADGFHMELEDYLGGLIMMSNELVKTFFPLSSLLHQSCNFSFPL